MPRCAHIMLDLETLSTHTSPAILQIAAVTFDPDTGEIGDRFCTYIKDWHGHVEPRTVLWWMQQPMAKALAAKCEAEGEILGAALEAFVGWYRQADARAQLGASEDDPGHAVGIEGLWSHGAATDVPWLAAAFDRIDAKVPWSYRVPRDTRTLYAVAPGGMPALTKDETREHDALYDCEYQVAQVSAAWQALAEARFELQVARAAEAAGLAHTERAGTSSDDCPVSSDYSPCAP